MTRFLTLTTPPCLLLLLLLFFSSLPSILASYRDWLALGPGGPPYNFFGFLVQSTSRLLARSDIRAVPPPYYRRRRRRPSPGEPEEADVVVDEAVVRAYAPHGRTSFLPPSPPLHPRNGPRPAVPAFVAPHRQTSMQGTPEMVGRMEAFLRRLGSREKETQNTLVEGCELIGVNRGERHRLSGVNRVLPWGYTLLYAPQNDYEFEVWTRLVVAACRFVTGGKDIKMVRA
ncbi:hypothetical protein L209DRAFT_693123 [Thermothelomyces heterothallicus CBS 203.75]